jgi:N-acetylglucosamine kinase-like BadF-type ATPase
VAVIAGTGSACLGRIPGGPPLKVGGWGHLLGDEGSGYDLARRALSLATRTADGRAAAGSVLRAALDHYGLADADGLVARAYADTAPAAVASFARPVVGMAEAGDADTRALLDESAADLALLAATVARRLGLSAAPVALAGGLLAASAYLRDRLVAALDPALAPVAFVADPACGALVLARDLL